MKMEISFPKTITFFRMDGASGQSVQIVSVGIVCSADSPFLITIKLTKVGALEGVCAATAGFTLFTTFPGLQTNAAAQGTDNAPFSMVLEPTRFAVLNKDGVAAMWYDLPPPPPPLASVDGSGSSSPPPSAAVPPAAFPAASAAVPPATFPAASTAVPPAAFPAASAAVPPAAFPAATATPIPAAATGAQVHGPYTYQG
ncbi:hypothetical protein GPECTOR_133g617 [Gonium pectorale]|uniref:Uncharacterized protein n=1 Tax=Gonium pectorale TaxID=33097 RepID=A0A150FYA8_GONPE|nr:hypothetical protein GPECTOR_133g617 [Gonium pectorale]|eukprot:KXZ42578.1 hypothetical protein GPECTOR_133g617 [Gonium pectorale]